MNLFKIKEVAELTSFYKRMIDDALKSGNNIRERKWTDSIAVSDKEFIEETRARLGILLKGDRVIEREGGYELHEQRAPYGLDLSGDQVI